MKLRPVVQEYEERYREAANGGDCLVRIDISATRAAGASGKVAAPAAGA
jgi:hypothetical protein